MTAIQVRGVSKAFRIPHERTTTLLERLLGMFRPSPVAVLQAVQDVSFEVPKGSFVGVIGSNGSGKSTLLKLMAGVLKPDSGSISVDGHLVPLLELGLGFHQELSVRENVALYGAVLGYPPSEMARS
jgi:ABC-type polysaccharide/polyol phosphate transport system ATPase subunit